MLEDGGGEEGNGGERWFGLIAKGKRGACTSILVYFTHFRSRGGSFTPSSR